MAGKTELLTMSGDEFREMCPDINSSFGSTAPLSATGSPPTIVGRRDSIISCASNPGLSGSSSSYYESLPSTPSNQEPFTRGYPVSSYQTYNLTTPMRGARDITQSFSHTPVESKFAHHAAHIEDDVHDRWFPQKPQMTQFHLPVGEQATFDGPMTSRVHDHHFGGNTSRYDFSYSQRNINGLPSPSSPASMPDQTDAYSSHFYNDAVLRSTEKLGMLLSSPMSHITNTSLHTSPWSSQAGYSTASLGTDSFTSDLSDQHYSCPTILSDDIDMNQSIYPPDLNGACESEAELCRHDVGTKVVSSQARRDKRRSTRRSKSSAKNTREGSFKHGSGYVTAQIREKPKEQCPAEGCKKAFARTEHLTRHMKNVHDNLRPYTCSLGKPWCKKGADGDSRIGRSDNQKDHYYTHIKLNKKKRNESPGRDFTYWLIRRHEGERAEKLINQIERKLEKEKAQAGEPNEDLLSKHHLWPEYCAWRRQKRASLLSHSVTC